MNVVRDLFANAGPAWLATHRVAHDHIEQATYVHSLSARLQWRISWVQPCLHEWREQCKARGKIFMAKLT